MAKEESKLVESVEETTATAESTEQENGEIKDEFNPLAFSEDFLTGLSEKTSDNDKDDTEDEDEDDDDFKWTSEKNEEKEEKEEKEEEYNWEEEKETQEEVKEEDSTANTNIKWEKVAEELGVVANSKDELVNAINTYIQQNTQKAPTGQTAELKRYLSFSDRDLVGEELKADGIEEVEIEESLDKLEDAGMLKMKAKSIRRLLNNAIESQAQKSKEDAVREKTKRKESANTARGALKGHLKDMGEFMGGKVTKKQKEEVYRYATNRMMDDIWSDHANVADVAMFMLYRKQIEKILRSQGLEEGKASIMNSITSPNLNNGKSKSTFKVKSGEFDPKAFISE